MKQIILCADDYAQNMAISEGIVHLAENNRINATSCMVNSPVWDAAHHALLPLQATLYTGLHFNLTHGNALSAAWKKHHGAKFPELPALLKSALCRRLNRDAVVAELQAQLDAYTKAMNAYPDFIDGHQHVHQLPVIRDALPSGVFIRNTTRGWADLFSMDGFPKRQLIALLGGLALNKQLKRQGSPTNSSFSGIYEFSHSHQYRQYFTRFLSRCLDNGLIMCHPGNVSDDTQDPLHALRQYELAYFSSDEYLQDLSRYSVRLKRKPGE